MQNYNPKNPINFHDLIVMADELHTALTNTIDTLLEVYDNGENCPSCGGEYNNDEGYDEIQYKAFDHDVLTAKHDENCSLAHAIELREQTIKNGQLKAVKKLHKVSN